jgi:hypothetical protein
MKIIYHCYGGTHSSVIAAAIHLGLLPEDRVPGGNGCKVRKSAKKQRGQVTGRQ